jgi:hypothetical protein
MSLCTAIHAEIVLTTVILLLVTESTGSGTSRNGFRWVDSGVVDGGRSSISARVLSWRRSGQLERFIAFQVSLEEAIVDAHGCVEESLQHCQSVRSGEFVLDRFLEADKELAD